MKPLPEYSNFYYC